MMGGWCGLIAVASRKFASCEPSTSRRNHIKIAFGSAFARFLRPTDVAFDFRAKRK